MRTSKDPIVLTDSQRGQLEQFARSRTVEVRTAVRCQIVLRAAEGWSNQRIAAALGLNRHSVEHWRTRFALRGVEGLRDAPRPGRPAHLEAEKVRVVVSQVVRPPAGRRRWSCRSMARHAGVSKSQVQRLWRANDLKPHLRRTFKLSRDARFEEKFWDVIGLYLDPPEKALILCCDEKSQCQALERTQPGLPLGVGHIATQTHDYYRHGTITLFAALNYLEGKVIGMTAPRHRHQEWLRFLKKLDAESPAELTLHLIVDNYSTHKHAKVRRWLDRRNRRQQQTHQVKRFEVHFIPTSSSWLNLVERFFADLTREVVRDGSFASVRELVEDIWRYLTDRNANPQRYVWRAKGEAILRKIQRAREAQQRAEAEAAHV
jgi:transposase/transcriptional regulator with XRE-family HTH domain